MAPRPSCQSKHRRRLLGCQKGAALGSLFLAVVLQQLSSLAQPFSLPPTAAAAPPPACGSTSAAGPPRRSGDFPRAGRQVRRPTRQRLAAFAPGGAELIQHYEWLLTVFPLQTKAMTNSLLFGVGDVIAQVRSPESRSINLDRMVKYMLTGLGSGVLWALWYSAADGLTAFAANDVVLRTISCLLLEQFVWCPIIFGLYLIPMSTLLNSGAAAIPAEVGRLLPGLLVENARVWTLANVVIYNVPVEFRVLTSNVVDVVWASVCADVVAACGDAEEEAEQSHPPQLQTERDVLVMEM